VQIGAKLSDKQLTCKPNPVHLGKGENMVRCSLDSGYDRGGASFVSQLIIEMQYSYAFSISKNVVIKRILR
jgi:hypothetical protein